LPELATRLGFLPEVLRTMLDVLVGQGLLDYDSPNYRLSREGERWLDPESPTSITTVLSQSLEYWNSMTKLEAMVSGRPDPAGRTGRR